MKKFLSLLLFTPFIFSADKFDQIYWRFQCCVIKDEIRQFNAFVPVLKSEIQKQDFERDVMQIQSEYNALKIKLRFYGQLLTQEQQQSMSQSLKLIYLLHTGLSIKAQYYQKNNPEEHLLFFKKNG